MNDAGPRAPRACEPRLFDHFHHSFVVLPERIREGGHANPDTILDDPLRSEDLPPESLVRGYPGEIGMGHRVTADLHARRLQSPDLIPGHMVLPAHHRHPDIEGGGESVFLQKWKPVGVL